ncbi:flagellar hook capping FlgD N-terminal domain-containing protein [Methyloversatilis thermotolerans]|uniref:flagellar hook capping FlgD N-terminal domain-containing protein n=1 Tax=Methyloversatilis thermotolerans TaxID=1346290 RepID=UPI000360BF84|nr:flagellar hook capping FlgD N-terminal domain-containing protein [Methyloversatilis thermotolerans]
METTQVGSSSQNVAESSGTVSSNGEISDLFTTLLVAQIRNQNPLEPTDASQFVNQLTQLTQVESLQSIADLTSANTSALSSLQMLAMGAQVGSEVMAVSDSVLLDGDAVSGSFTLESSSSETSLLLTGSDGVQHTIALGTLAAGDVPFEIDPQALGLPAGRYSVSVSTSSGETPDIEFAGRLLSVRASGSAVVLNIEGLGEVLPGYVTRFNGRTATSVN